MRDIISCEVVVILIKHYAAAIWFCQQVAISKLANTYTLYHFLHCLKATLHNLWLGTEFLFLFFHFYLSIYISLHIDIFW